MSFKKWIVHLNDISYVSLAITCHQSPIQFIFRYSSPVLRVVPPVKSTSWLLTSLGWPIGDPLASNTLCIIVTFTQNHPVCVEASLVETTVPKWCSILDSSYFGKVMLNWTVIMTKSLFRYFHECIHIISRPNFEF